MTLAFLCHLWEQLPGCAAQVCTGGRTLETQEWRGKTMLVVSRNPVTFCRESQRERIYLEMGVPIALMLFKWDTIHLVNMRLYIYQILWTFCNITLMSIWNVLPYIQLGKPLPGWGHPSLFWFYIMSFFFWGPSSTENFLGWLLGDSKTGLFISTVRCFYLQQMLHLLSVAVPSIHFFIRRTQFPIPCQHILAMEVFLFCMCSAQDRCVTQKHTCFSFCPMPLLASCLANLTLFCIDFMLWVTKFSIDFFFWWKRNGSSCVFYLERKVSHYWEVSDIECHTVECPMQQ